MSIPDRGERLSKIEIFRESCERSGLTEVAPLVFESPRRNLTRVTLSTLIHGNEIGGMEVFLRLIGEIGSKALVPACDFRLILGNVNAYLEDKRYLESDLNRAFGIQAPRTLEEKRAIEIQDYIADSAALIDVHQTVGITRTPFFIFEEDMGSYNLARFLHADLPVIMNALKRDFKGTTSTAYAIGKGVKAITLETGQKNIEDSQIALALGLLRKALTWDWTQKLPDAPVENAFRFSQIIANPTGALELVRKFTNFDPIIKGELLARGPEGEVFAECDGVILFPKYGDYAKASRELALILSSV